MTTQEDEYGWLIKHLSSTLPCTECHEIGCPHSIDMEYVQDVAKPIITHIEEAVRRGKVEEASRHKTDGGYLAQMVNAINKAVMENMQLGGKFYEAGGEGFEIKEMSEQQKKVQRQIRDELFELFDDRLAQLQPKEKSDE